jgi:hypothetical protein
MAQLLVTPPVRSRVEGSSLVAPVSRHAQQPTTLQIVRNVTTVLTTNALSVGV